MASRNAERTRTWTPLEGVCVCVHVCTYSLHGGGGGGGGYVCVHTSTADAVLPSSM